MEDNLQRKKEREQKEKEKRRRELEQQREKEERERKRVSNLGSIREGVVETGNGTGSGSGSGMDANELLHLNAVLDARERARSTQGVEVERGVEVVRESGLGWVGEGLKSLTLDEEREKGEENEKGKEDKKEKEEKDEKEQVVKWNYKTKEDRKKRHKEKSKEERERMERARKRYTGIDALGKVKAATAMLEEMVAKEWEDEDARDDGNEGGEARKHGESQRHFGVVEMRRTGS